MTLLFASFIGEAPAFVEAPQNGELEIRMPMHDYSVYEHQTSTTLDAGRRLAATASTELGGQWSVVGWNPITETPHNLLGSGIETGAILSSDEIAEATARDFISAHSEIFGADVSDLTLGDVRRGLGKVAVHFNQTYHGIEVWESRVKLLFMESGRLYAMGSDFHRDIDVDPRPFLTANQATEIAKNDLPFDPSTDRIDGEVELLVLPVPYSADDAGYHLVWRVRVSTEDPLGIWVSHVDAHDGQIVWRYNDIHFLDYYGDATSEVQHDTYCNGVGLEPCRYLDVSVDGLGGVTTDIDGLWNAGEGGTDTRDVDADLYGPYVDVNNMGGVNAHFSGTATAGESFTLDFRSGNAQHDERDVFAAVNDIHDYFELFDPGYIYSNTRIIANVSLNETCNAYWNGSINFFREGNGCANTGEIQGVVHHEFGHGVQNNLIGGQGGQGLGEGNSDILANLMTQESIIGRGFYLNNCAIGIRNSDNNRQYPGDLNGQVHNDGMIIAGVHWDLMVLLQDFYGQDDGQIVAATLWHFCRKLWQPTLQPDQVLAIFLVDDNDGDLTNGTEHYLDICTAAENHGFDCLPLTPGVHFTHDELWDQAPTREAYEVIAEAWSTEGNVLPESIFMHWRVDGGGWSDVDMDPTGNPNEYAAVIPEQVLGAFIEYYLEGEDDQGYSGTGPEGAPGNLWDFQVVTYHDPLEAESGWTIGADDDDAVRGVWERVDPVGTAAAPYEDNTSFPGTHCFITDQHDGDEGGWQGESDVDGGKTTLFSPIYDLTGSETVATLKYYRWYSTDTGNNGGEDPWIVRISNDAGASWVEIENTVASDRSWRLIEVDLFTHFPEPESLQVMFEASDYGTNAIVEAGVDDLSVIADLGQGTVAVEPVSAGIPSAAYLADASPNPFNPRTTIQYGLTDRTSVRLEIFDVNGRLVTTLVNTRQAPGHHAVSWDGRDNSGRALSSGIYYARLTTGTMQVSRKLSLLR